MPREPSPTSDELADKLDVGPALKKPDGTPDLRGLAQALLAMHRRGVRLPPEQPAEATSDRDDP
jgi:hypothetical protein